MKSAGLCLSFEASEQSEQSIAPCLCPRLLADTMADNFECQLEIGVPFYPFEWLCSKAPPICVGPYSSWDSSEHLPDLKHRICALDIFGQLLPFSWFCCFFLFFSKHEGSQHQPATFYLQATFATVKCDTRWGATMRYRKKNVLGKPSAYGCSTGPPWTTNPWIIPPSCLIWWSLYHQLYLYIALLRTALCFCQVLIPYPTTFSHLN